MENNYRKHICRKCGKEVNMFSKCVLTDELYSYLCPDCEEKVKSILEEYGFRGVD